MIAKVKRELLVALWKLMPKCTKIKINNVKFKVPLQRNIDHKLMGTDREKWMDEIIKLIFENKRGIFIDVGSHAGQTLLKLKSIMPQVQYIGFEPNAYCAGYINTVINENNFQNCQIFPIGLGENEEILKLYCHNISDPTGTVVENFRGREESLLKQTVMMQHAGRFLNRLNIHEVSAIKIDVEGFEAAVLAGLEDILRQQRPFVICEVLRTHSPGYPSYAFRTKSRATCEAVLHEVGYAIWAVRDRNVMEPWEHIRDTCTNYVFAPKESENVLKRVS